VPMIKNAHRCQLCSNYDTAIAVFPYPSKSFLLALPASFRII
jgi:hypothetical protein